MALIKDIRNKHYQYSLKELYDYLQANEDDSAIRESAMSGDLVLVLTPATAGSSAATINAGSFTRDVLVELKNTAGDIHNWFTGTFAIAVVDDTAGDGSSAIAESATTVALTNGVGTVTIEYSGTWASDDTETLTVTGGTKLGYSIDNKTSVDTAIA